MVEGIGATAAARLDMRGVRKRFGVTQALAGEAAA